MPGDRFVDIHIAGVCAEESGLGGWGAVLRYGEHVKELEGGESGPTTGHQMTLTAAAEALTQLTRSAAVRLHVAVDVESASGSDDTDLRQRLDDALQRHRVDWVRVGEADVARAAALARQGMPVVARCVHELVVDQCWECRPRRAQDLPARVAITRAGAVFHILEACSALHDGWRQVDRRGAVRGDLIWVPTADALAAGRGACEVCCADLIRKMRE